MTRTYKLDPNKIEYLRLQHLLTIEQLVGALGWDIRTYDKLLKGGELLIGKAALLAEHFKIDLPKILHPDELNGLKIEIWEMGHLNMHQRKGRGKCYDLADVSQQTRTQLREYFTRHAEVCDRVGNHPRIAKNFAVTPDCENMLWWVIDEKVGPTLERQLTKKTLAPKQTLGILREILEGLQAIHEAFSASRLGEAASTSRRFVPKLFVICHSDRA